MEKKQSNFRLDEATRDLIGRLQAHFSAKLGISALSQADVLEMVVKDRARSEGLWP